MAESALASEAEIQAALADTDVGAIPSLDDGATVVPVPVPNVPSRAAEDDRYPVATVPDSGTVRTHAGETDAPPALPLPVSWGARLYALADRVLDVVNRPFRWMSPAVRQATGISGLCMLGTALVALTVLPFFQPRAASVTPARSAAVAPQTHDRAQAKTTAAPPAPSSPTSH